MSGVLGLISCRKDLPDPVVSVRTADFDNSAALAWMELFLEVERFTPGYRPPVSGRTAAYIGLAGYEAVQPGMADEFNSFSGYYLGLRVPAAEPAAEYHWPACLNAAYARAFTLYFPGAPAVQQAKIFALESALNDRFSAERRQDVFNRSVAFGKQVADAVYEWSRQDIEGHEGYLNNNDPAYVPPSGHGLWQPTFPDFTPALLPNWGKVRTFAATADDRVRPPLQGDDPGSLLYVQALEVRNRVNKIRSGLSDPDTYEDNWIAEFWSDDCPILTFTPAGRWIAVANQIVQDQKVSLDIAAYTYAKLNMGLCDAGIRCWHEKYRHNVERPIDYIRRVMGDTQWNTVMCPDGTGNFFTPPFPAYPSGHATFGAVSAAILSSIYGYNYRMTDRCHEGRPEFKSTPRTFSNFYRMAEENAESRIPLGVHFRMDAEEGLELGYRVGERVNRLPWHK